MGGFKVIRFKWPCRLKTSFFDRDFLGFLDFLDILDALDILDIPRMVSPFSFNPASRSLPPSHLGNSSKLDCARFGVGSPFSFPSWFSTTSG